MKVAITERHCMEVLYTEFHPNSSRNVDSTVINQFRYLTEVRFTKPVLTELVLAL
jgi:hypothetical protein